MLHGIVALCPRTGSLLYAKAYAPSFGLPLPSGGQHMDSHNFASLLFALQLNADAVLDGNKEDEHSAKAAQNVEPALKCVDMGPGLRLVFYKDAKLPGLLLTLSLDPALGSRAQRLLAESICNSFADAFGEQLRLQAGSVGAGGPVRRLRGATDLVQQCLATVSQSLLEAVMQTFAERGAVLWGHAMQPDEKDLETLGVLRPLEVSGKHGSRWDDLAPEQVSEATMHMQGKLPVVDTCGHAFQNGKGAVGIDFTHNGVDTPVVKSGAKRKAPEKLLLKCSKVQLQTNP